MTFQKDALVLQVKDYFVSKQTFSLYRDDSLDMLTTVPKPELHQLRKYYESDDYISHTDGKRSLFEIAYQIVKRFALGRKVSLINDLHPKGKLLDIGAGTGDFLRAAKRDGWHATGSEPNVKAQTVAREKGIQLHDDTSGLDSNSFDVITMWHVLEHVYDLEAQITELRRLLRPGGFIVIAVPNFKSYDAQHYGEYWAAYDVPRHLWHFSRSSIEKLFEREAITLHRTLPMIFDAYYVSLLSEKYKAGKMNFFNAFRTGWASNRSAKKTKEYSSQIYILSVSK